MQWVQSALWILLAVSAINVWRRYHDRASTWLASTFAVLGLVIVVAFFLPSDPTEIGDYEVAIKVLISALALFPFLLYRFLCSLVERRRWEWLLAHTLTAGVIVATLFLGDFESIAERPTGLARAYIFLFGAQWVFVLGCVSFRLWQSGQGQATVARRRMQTMSLGSLALAATILVSIAFPDSEEMTAAQIVGWAVGLLAGPLFLFGFAPPRFLRTLWRSREEAELRLVEIGLVKALSKAEIADALLPRTVGLLGGRSAALLDIDGTAIGRYRMSMSELGPLTAKASDESPNYEPIALGDARVLRMENGWLVVTVSPLTPFFGGEELQMLSALAVLADLALGRAALFELEARSRDAMRDFVAIASHDLRTPVTVIQGFSQLMTQQWDVLSDEKRQGFAAAIERQSVLLDRLVRDILTVSRLDVQEVEVLTLRVDVSHSAEDAVASMTEDAEVNVRSKGCVIAQADPEHVSRMLHNYLRNALVYGAPPYTVEIEGRDGWVTVRVRDGGVGVPTEFAPKLFDKFARVDKKKSRAVQGTGLGLSIVKGLAEANGGNTWYEHNDPRGACFGFRLPAAADDTDTGETNVHTS